MPATNLAAPALPAPAGSTGLLVQPLQGGIGNQLFQLCATFSLARGFGLEPAFDLSRYARDRYGRRSLLQRLWPDARVVALDQLPAAQTRVLDEAQWHWPADAAQPPRLALPAGVQHLVLEGYWQDHRLVHADDLARLRQHLAAQFGEAAAPYAGLVGPAATAVHVRRHDYKHHGLCFERYYTESLAALQARDGGDGGGGGGGGGELLVFSDEPNYTGHFLRAAGIRHRIVRSGDDLLDLYLMSCCGRHVISNSSFSWWAARLADSRLVLWPSPWSRLQADSATLCPPHWVQVPGAVDLGPLETALPASATAAIRQALATARAGVAGPAEPGGLGDALSQASQASPA